MQGAESDYEETLPYHGDESDLVNYLDDEKEVKKKGRQATKALAFQSSPRKSPIPKRKRDEEADDVEVLAAVKRPRKAAENIGSPYLKSKSVVNVRANFEDNNIPAEFLIQQQILMDEFRSRGKGSRSSPRLTTSKQQSVTPGLLQARSPNSSTFDEFYAPFVIDVTNHQCFNTLCNNNIY